MSDSTSFPVRASAVSSLSEKSSLGNPARRRDSSRSKVPTSIAIWSWIAVVFLALMGVKVLLIVGQGESLYEAHWRIGAIRMNFLNYVAFGGLLVLGGLSLVRLGESCRQSGGIKSVRVVNAVVVILGLSFIFLTFHNGDKNYLYPILSGVLQWTSVGPYVANSLFFNQPFLAGWVFVYAFSYYVLVRKGRERWALRLSAVFGVTYALIYLEEFMIHRTDLLIIDCLGVVALVSARRSNVSEAVRPSRLSAGWLILPAMWALFFGWTLLHFDTQWHSNPATYFLSLLGLTLILFLAAAFFVRRSGNPPIWSWLVPFFFAGFFMLVNNNYPASRNYGHLVELCLTSPHYFAGDLALVSLLGLAAWAYRKLRPCGSLWWLDLAGLGLVVIAVIDLRLSQIMGVRLGWDVLAFGDSPKMMLKMAKPYLPGAVAGLFVAGAIYVLVLRAIRNWSARHSSGSRLLSSLTSGELIGRAEDVASSPPSDWLGQEHSYTATIRPATYYLAAVFVSLSVLGVATADSDKVQAQAAWRLVQTSPLWKRVANHPMRREEFLNSATALGLGDFRPGRGAIPVKPPRDLNVVVVFMESSYNKHLSLFGSSEETQPLLSKYQDRMELFPNFFSAFTGSIHARFATFTSLYPVQDFQAFTQERVPVKSLFEVLHERGYSCSMFYSSYFDYTGFRDFLKNRGLDEMYDADTMPGPRTTKRVEWGLLEEETLGAMRSQLKKYAQSHQRFCLTYVPAAPHYPYDKIPKAFQKHKMTAFGDFKPLYLDELLYMDWVLASIMDELKESGLLEHTLVVITNDHGEMLGGSDGQIGHGWKITPELANTPLILMDPERPGFHLNQTIGTQVDLLPTILDRLNIPVPADQLYEGLSLDAGAERTGRRAYLNSYNQFGMISGDEILLGDRQSGNGVGSTSAAYRISNEGPKTLFTEEEQAAAVLDRPATMSSFDAFQASLLRNYSAYCASVHGAVQQQAKR